MASSAQTSERGSARRWERAPADSDAATYVRIGFWASGALAAALLLTWIGAALAAGPLGSKAHFAFLAATSLAAAIFWSVARARKVHIEELGEFEFSVESATARQVAAESALLVYRDMLQEAGIGWYRLDADGHLVTATQATVDLLGYGSVDQMREAYQGKIFPASEHRKAVLNALRAVGEVRGHTASWPTAEGDILQVRDSARTIRDHEGKIVFIEGFVAADSWAPGSDSRIQRLEAELASARSSEGVRESRPGDADLQYVAHMSHELRTPLNAIIGATSLLESSKMDRAHRELVDTLRLASASLLSVVENTLDYSRLEAGALELDRGPVDARVSIEEAIALVAGPAGEKGLEVAYRVADDIPECFLGDGNRLRQVLANLLSNAVRNTSQGEILVRLEAEPEANGLYTFHFSVRDTGSGIPADRLKRLFEPYYQGNEDAERRAGGSGLGLSIARLLVERMGGRIWVESEHRAGSTFHFTVVARPTEQPVRADSRAAAGLRVLLLDDHSSSRSSITAHLESLGMSVNATNRADLAIDLLRGETTFDLVAVSLESQIASIAFASRIRRENAAPNLPIVLIAPVGSTAEPPPLARCVRISKPIRRDSLAQALLDAMEPEARATALPDSVAAPIVALSVLVAEDDAVNGRIISRMIERLGHRVTLVDRGDAVLPAASAGDFDLVLLDVRMPGMTGPEAARAVRERMGAERNAPRMIGMTASTDPEEHRQCLDAGMSACLLKPITQAVLASALAADPAPPRRAVSRRSVTDPTRENGRSRNDWIDPAADDSVHFDQEPNVPDSAPETIAGDDPVAISIRRAAAGRFRNDRAAIASALTTLERTAHERLREMSQSVEAGDFERLARAAGRFKEDSSAVGLSRIAALSKALEATSTGNPRAGAVLPFVRALAAACDEVMPVVRHESRRFGSAGEV